MAEGDQGGVGDFCIFVLWIVCVAIVEGCSMAGHISDV
jgi:hypothetical protein